MLDDDDLSAAVAGGALTEEAAVRVRAFLATRREAAGADEENFRLLTGFNDVFVAIAIALTLLAIAVLGAQFSLLLPGPAVAVAAWPMAELFTRRRRMALPSILLVLAFAGGVGGFGLAAAASIDLSADMSLSTGLACACAGAALHWWRFRVPITIAALTLSFLAAVLAALLALLPALYARLDALTLAAGCTVFLAALLWDASDPQRLTRRADVAFWLHLAAAPLIVHPVFAMVGLLASDDVRPGKAVVAIAIYAALGLVALVIDRRAVLVSALAYVVYAISTLLAGAGSLTTALALTGGVIGLALLMVSVWWRALRAPLVRLLPDGARRCVPAA